MQEAMLCEDAEYQGCDQCDGVDAQQSYSNELNKSVIYHNGDLILT